MKLTFREIFKIPLMGMKITRSHPNIPKDVTWFFTILMMHGIFTILFIIVLYNIFGHNLKNKDFAQTCKNGTLMVVYITVTLQYIVILRKAKKIKNIFNTIKTDYNHMQFLKCEEQEVVTKYAKMASSFNKLWFLMLFCGVFTFPIKNLIIQIYYYIKDEYRIIHLYDLIYPKILDERKNTNIFIYTILYSCMMYYAIYCSCIYAAFAPLAPNFMLHACGQLEILTKRVHNLSSAEDVTTELRSIIIELQRIYNFVEEIKHTFRVAYEFTLNATAILLPITVYEIIEAFKEGELSVEFIVFIIGAILISGSPCYYSEMLMKKGETLRTAVYTCGWELTYERRTRKMLALLLQSASRPIALRTMLKTMCLEVLTDVGHMSYGIFNLMNAMWN